MGTERNLGALLDDEEHVPAKTEKSNDAPQVKIESEAKDNSNESNDRSNLLGISEEEEPIKRDESHLTAADIVAGTAPAIAKIDSLPPRESKVQANLNEVNQKLTGAQDIHSENMRMLDEAKKHHDFLLSDAAVEAHMPEHLRGNVTVEAAPDPTLTRVPEGGTGVGNYAEKFVPPHEAMDATSMSQVQKDLIPRNAARASLTQRLAPGTILTKESPLALTPEAQKAKLAQMKAEQILAQERADARAKAVEEAKREAHAKLEPHRVQAAEDLSRAEAEANKSKIALKDLATRQDRLSSNLADVAGRSGSKIGNIVRYGGDLLGKLSVPAALASVPSEYQQAIESGKKAWNSGDIKDWGETAKHTAGVASGALAAAPYLAAAGLLAPEVGAGLATTGAIGGLSILATEAPQLYRKYIQDRGE
jgi:F0F1-type ATP synthase membrane subunit b/b'